MSGLFGFWLRFGSVTAPLGRDAPSPKPRQKPKILAPRWLQFFFKCSSRSNKARRTIQSRNRERERPGRTGGPPADQPTAIHAFNPVRSRTRRSSLAGRSDHDYDGRAALNYSASSCCPLILRRSVTTPRFADATKSSITTEGPNRNCSRAAAIAACKFWPLRNSA